MTVGPTVVPTRRASTPWCASVASSTRPPSSMMRRSASLPLPRFRTLAGGSFHGPWCGAATSSPRSMTSCPLGSSTTGISIAALGRGGTGSGSGSGSGTTSGDDGRRRSRRVLVLRVVERRRAGVRRRRVEARRPHRWARASPRCAPWRRRRGDARAVAPTTTPIERPSTSSTPTSATAPRTSDAPTTPMAATSGPRPWHPARRRRCGARRGRRSSAGRP